MNPIHRTECTHRARLSLDRLVDLSALLGREPLASLEHLAGCECCREALERTAAVRASLTAEVIPREGFVDQVVQAAASGQRKGSAITARPVAPRWTTRWVVRGFNAALATAAALALIRYAG